MTSNHRQRRTSLAATSCATAQSASARIALATLISDAAQRSDRTESARPAAAALPGQGEERHLPAHGRLAAAPRPVRLQAGAGQAQRRRTVPSRSCAASASRSPAACRSCWARRSTSPSTARAGPWISEALPQHRRRSPTSCRFIKSMHTDQFNHAPAELLLFTGSPQFGRPSMGSWVTYGLGSESQNLPGFVVLVSSGTFPSAGKSVWGSGFLPSVYQGVQCRSQGDPVLYVSNPRGMDRDVRRLSLDALRDLNEMQAAELGNPETLTRIAQYELAFRMQTAVPEVMDISASRGTSSTCTAPSPARRASPTTACWPAGWSSRACASCSSTTGAGTSTAPAPARTSRPACATSAARWTEPVAALIRDLKHAACSTRRWSSGAASSAARRSAKAAPPTAPTWAATIIRSPSRCSLAGGGIKPGIDLRQLRRARLRRRREPGPRPRPASDDPAPARASTTPRLTYRFQGRDFRLTDVHGSVINDVLA